MTSPSAISPSLAALFAALPEEHRQAYVRHSRPQPTIFQGPLQQALTAPSRASIRNHRGTKQLLSMSTDRFPRSPSTILHRTVLD